MPLRAWSEALAAGQGENAPRVVRDLPRGAGGEQGDMSNDPDIRRTPNPNCPACREMRLHTEAERKEFHPDAGHGYTRETGWSKQGMDKR